MLVFLSIVLPVLLLTMTTREESPWHLCLVRTELGPTRKGSAAVFLRGRPTILTLKPINGFLSQSFKKCSDHYFKYVESECSKAIWSHFFFNNPWSFHAVPWLDSAHGTHTLDIKLPADASAHLPPGYHWKTSSPLCHRSDEMTSGCSLCLIKGIEECPWTRNPAPSCLTLVGWVVSDQSHACLPVTSDKGPSDPWRS